MVSHESEPISDIGERIEVHFRPFLTCTSKRLAKAAAVAVESIFKASTTRQRKPRKAAVESSVRLAESLFANLAYQVALGEIAPSIIVPLGKPRKATTRYHRKALAPLPSMVEGLHKQGWIVLQKATHKRGIASTIKPAPRLTALLNSLKLTAQDFVVLDGEETIILSQSSYGFKVNNEGQSSFGKQSDWLGYSDTPHTRTLRAQLAAINTWLASADIKWTGSHLVDVHARRLRRHFSLPLKVTSAKGFKWDRGGRLFAGFWQTLKKADRPQLRIDGELMADLDFNALYVRLALARDGIELPPEFDPYAISGLPRDVAKMAINTLLNSKGAKLPKDLKRELPDWTMKRLRKTVTAHLPDLEPHLGKGIGLELMYTESQILMAVLEECMAAGITALPMHDGVMVADSQADKVAAMMENHGKVLTGIRLPVKRKGLGD
jgi:hypothetical protein